MDCLYFSASWIEELKNTKDEKLKRIVAAVLHRAEKAKEMPVVSEASVRVDGEGFVTQHENYGEACGPLENNMLYLAFGYYYTGDKAYFEKARELMLAYVAYSKWYGKGFQGRGELNTGHFCVGMGYGIACFGSVLSAEDRRTITQGTYRLGILPLLEDWMLPGKKLHCFDTMGHNWWPVCVSSGAFAAVIMKEDLPDCGALADQACAALEQWFAYQGNELNNKLASIDNGAFYEGVGYYNYLLKEYLRFAQVYKMICNKAPFEDGDLLRQAADFFVQTAYLSDEADYFVAFGDCDGQGFVESSVYLLACHPEYKELRWLLQNRPQGIADNQILKLLHYNNIYSEAVVEPTQLSALYANCGWAIFRDSFENNATMFAVKCGDSWNHSHDDAGHFLLYRNGTTEIFDSGCCSYANDIYRDYYVQSFAHNVLLFDGKGQDWRDHHDHIRMRGRLLGFTDEPGFRYVAADATGPMGRFFRKHLRHFLWLRDFVLIYDDVQSYEPGTVSFLLHANEDTCFRMLTPCSLTRPHGYIGNDVQDCTYLSYNRPTDENGRVKFVSVLALNENKVPTFEELANGYKLTCGEMNVYINLFSDGRIMHRNCITEFDGITTDAIILTEENGEFAVVNGSIVRKDEKSFLDTLARVHGKCKKNLQNY